MPSIHFSSGAQEVHFSDGEALARRELFDDISGAEALRYLPQQSHKGLSLCGLQRRDHRRLLEHGDPLNP